MNDFELKLLDKLQLTTQELQVVTYFFNADINSPDGQRLFQEKLIAESHKGELWTNLNYYSRLRVATVLATLAGIEVETAFRTIVTFFMRLKRMNGQVTALLNIPSSGSTHQLSAFAIDNTLDQSELLASSFPHLFPRKNLETEA